jgi:hypothetical protein
MGHGDTRHGGSPEMVVGDQESGRHLAEHSDLMPDVHQIRAGGGLDLTDHLELAGHEQTIDDSTVNPMRCPGT